MTGEGTRAARARSYFSQPGFGRILREIWDKYAGLEKAGGHAVIKSASAEECEVINAFMGWYKRAGEDVRIPLAEFQRELLNSAFPYTIPELHVVITGRPLLTKSDRKLVSAEKWRSLFSSIKRLLGREGADCPSVVAEWISGLEQGAAAGYRTLRELWRQSPDKAEKELWYAVRAWTLLIAMRRDAPFGNGRNEGDMAIRLPVLAAQAVGDPHALDRNTAAGRLLFQALQASQSSPLEEGIHGASDVADDSGMAAAASLGADSLKVREIYRGAGVLDDDISSSVHYYLPVSRQARGPGVLTLRQVEADLCLEAVTRIYIVENPAVFSSLVDWSEQRIRDGIVGSDRHTGPLLLCTSGPASAAALRWIDRYVQEERLGGNIYYSGDFDVKGIEIGNVLATRYASCFKPWRFDAAAYESGCDHAFSPGVVFSDEDCMRLGKLQAVWDQLLCDKMSRKKRKLYQEEILTSLIFDWRAALGIE
ncbi:TIGR02679 domain-containing protein [Paenibacillus sp. J5C_2022]|uniref:TIGR02679 domain-containing protein n=1 Tax=Paenibacillus sp. J5C2022 TaxID=2977129 RepID=UPI0021CEC3C7|nr:TIGR02679 domain-containing protein [Paenibacillus sp. J5C2022]MCU6708690.1 TIGR02679 domain-containing protein [Paenibacillus sp. J5C2022]